MTSIMVQFAQRVSAFARKHALSLGLAICAVGMTNVAMAATVSSWTFETSLPATAGPFSPEIGAGSALGLHSDGGAVYSTPAGNGSTHSFSSNTWNVGDYYQFQVSTLGLQNVMLTWDQTSSNTGPRDFNLQYSTDGSSFTNFGSTMAVLANASPNPVWSTSTPHPEFSFSKDLSSITGINNASTVYFRLTDASTTSANAGTVAVAGTDRVDNFTVSATPVPEPSSIVLAGLSVFGIALGALRHRMLRSTK